MSRAAQARLRCTAHALIKQTDSSAVSCWGVKCARSWRSGPAWRRGRWWLACLQQQRRGWWRRVVHQMPRSVPRGGPRRAAGGTPFCSLGTECTASAWGERGPACRPVNRSRLRQSNTQVTCARPYRLVAPQRAARRPMPQAPLPRIPHRAALSARGGAAGAGRWRRARARARARKRRRRWRRGRRRRRWRQGTLRPYAVAVGTGLVRGRVQLRAFAPVRVCAPWLTRRRRRPSRQRAVRERPGRHAAGSPRSAGDAAAAAGGRRRDGRPVHPARGVGFLRGRGSRLRVEGRRLLSCRRRGALPCLRPTDERPGEQEVYDASVVT